MNNKISLGLDVAKKTFDACVLWDNGKTDKQRFPNTQAGFNKLLVWLHGWDSELIHVCLEPTGYYSRALANFIWHQGFRVSMVNSYTVQCHGRSRNFRSKNDRIDAFLLADYCFRHDPPAWAPPSPVQQELREVQHRLASIDEHIRQEENRLEAVDSKPVREDIEENLGRLYVRQKKLEKLAKKLIDTDETLSEHFKILYSIIGLGEKSVVRLLAHVQFDKFDESRNAGSFAGLAPREFESGTSIRKRPQISRVGSSELRAALYFPAMVAMQHNPQLREFSDRLKARNKPPKVVICAVMRKLLVLAATLVRNGQFYDPSYCSPLALST
jgi:transposase